MAQSTAERPLGQTDKVSPDSFVRMWVFDDDGPEGYFQETFWTNSYDAACYFCINYDHNYHCTITQLNKKEE